jgi:hypothetical protein
MAVVRPDHSREPTPVGLYSWDFATSIRWVVAGYFQGSIRSFCKTAHNDWYRKA